LSKLTCRLYTEHVNTTYYTIMSSSTPKLLIGSALLLAAAAATSYISSKNSSSESNSRELVEIDDEVLEGENFITGDDVCKVFDRLFMEMQAVLAQLSHTVQQIQMSGQVIPEQQLRQLLITEYERALTVKTKQALDEADMDDDCFEEATWEFLDKENEYPKVKKSVERFQKLWENVSGENVVGKRKGGVQKEEEVVDILPAEKTIEVAEVYFDALTTAMGDLVASFKEDGKDLRDPKVAQQLQMEFSSVANDKGEEALKELGISQLQFQKSIEANASDPKVGRALAMLQMKQQQALASLGVA
jgi:hypothetical protein